MCGGLIWGERCGGVGVVVYVLCGGLHFVVLRWMCIGVSTKQSSLLRGWR
jgi:hypothetical protein